MGPEAGTKSCMGRAREKKGKMECGSFSLRQTQFSREKGEIQGKEVNIHVSKLSVNVQI